MLTAARGAVPGLAPGKLNVEYVAMDGTLHAMPLADAARVRAGGGHLPVSPPAGRENIAEQNSKNPGRAAGP
jgi:hypothetical protein